MLPDYHWKSNICQSDPYPDIVVDGVLLIPIVPHLMCLESRLILLTFELHLHSFLSSISQKISLLGKCNQIHSSDKIVKTCFNSFILPHFEYCYSMWISTAESYLKLLDGAFNQIENFPPDLEIDLWHHHLVASLTCLIKIMSISTTCCTIICLLPHNQHMLHNIHWACRTIPWV